MATGIKFQWTGGRAMQRLTSATKRGVDKAMKLIHKESLRLILEEPKTGRRYKGHIASAPGEAPASRTGGLVSKFRIQVTVTGDVITGSLTNTSPNARLLELGSSRIKPRPFLRPAAVNMKSAVLKTIATELGRELMQK